MAKTIPARPLEKTMNSQKAIVDGIRTEANEAAPLPTAWQETRPSEAPLTVDALKAFMRARNIARQHGAVVYVGKDGADTESRFTEGYCYAIAEVLDILEGRLIVDEPIDVPRPTAWQETHRQRVTELAADIRRLRPQVPHVDLEDAEALEALIAALSRRDPPSAPLETTRCEGRYPVPHPRSEPFQVTYRCALPIGHEGPHGAESAPSAPPPPAWLETARKAAFIAGWCSGSPDAVYDAHLCEAAYVEWLRPPRARPGEEGK